MQCSIGRIRSKMRNYVKYQEPGGKWNEMRVPHECHDENQSISGSSFFFNIEILLSYNRQLNILELQCFVRFKSIAKLFSYLYIF